MISWEKVELKRTRSQRHSPREKPKFRGTFRDKYLQETQNKVQFDNIWANREGNNEFKRNLNVISEPVT